MNLQWIKQDWMYIVVIILCLAAILQLTMQTAELQKDCSDFYNKQQLPQPSDQFLINISWEETNGGDIFDKDTS